MENRLIEQYYFCSGHYILNALWLVSNIELSSTSLIIKINH